MIHTALNRNCSGPFRLTPLRFDGKAKISFVIITLIKNMATFKDFAESCLLRSREEEVSCLVSQNTSYRVQ